MSKATLPWWQNFQVIAWVIGGVGALGTAAVVAARYIDLPSQVEAGEQKNTEQDLKLYDLSRIADQNQQILDRVTNQQQQAQQPSAPRPPAPSQTPRAATPHREWVEQDAENCWSCWTTQYERCWEESLWLLVNQERCE